MTQPATPLAKTVFELPKMDCPSEEQMIRMALNGYSPIQSLDFNLAARRLAIVHEGSADDILTKLTPLGLGARVVESKINSGVAPSTADIASERSTLRVLFAINGVMFCVEIFAGFLAQSTGLIADSLDMFADAAVYAISLYAVGKASTMKLRAAHLSGWLQLLLAVGAFAEVARRLIFGNEPEPTYMIAVAILALAANAYCMYLISSHRKGEAHMRASWIFSTNDVIANLGVIIAGLLVGWTGSSIPDLVIGGIIASVVLLGALRILRFR